jgi:AcrR family transcriptional regulator
MSLARAPRHLDRRPQILDAAEACFTRSGFHRTTMQDVAGEAGMVPGNLYRYFPSKDALILALIERDRAEIATDFAALVDTIDLMGAFRSLGRRHFIEKPREKAVLTLEIWSEAARNPAIADVMGGVQAEVRRGIIAVCEKARSKGEIPHSIDLDAVARLILTVSDGLIRRRALDPDFESETEVATLLDLIGAVLCGAVSLRPCSAFNKINSR